MTDRRPAVCRVSVHADHTRADLSLPAGVPVAELIPVIVDIVCAGRDRLADPPVPYRLSVAGAAALDDTRSLAEQSVRDGSLLLLSRATVEPPGPRFDDPAERVAAVSTAVTRRCTPGGFRLAAATATAWFTAIGVALAAHRGATVAAAAAAVAASGALSGAVLVDRLHRDRAATRTLSLTAVVAAAAAGFAAVPGGGGPENVLLSATAAAATAGLLLTTVAGGDTAMTAVIGLAALLGAAALAMTLTGVSLPAVAAVLAAVAIALLHGAARIATTLGGLTRRPAAELCDAAITGAQQLLTGLVLAFTAAAAAGSLGAVAAARLGQTPRPVAAAFVAAVGASLGLLARSQTGRLRSAVPLAAGAGLLGVALLAIGGASFRAALVVTAALVAIAACGTVAGPPAAGAVRRGLDLMEWSALTTLVPLAGWVAGCYGTVRGLVWG